MRAVRAAAILVAGLFYLPCTPLHAASARSQTPLAVLATQAAQPPYAALASNSLEIAATDSTDSAAQTPHEHHHDAIEPAQQASGSLYDLDFDLRTSTGTARALQSFRGTPLLVTLFYSHCTSVCPLLTSELQRIVRDLTPAERDRLTVLMVSLDSLRDTPTELHAFAMAHQIVDGPAWVLAQADADDVRALAAVLGIRYRALPDGSFNHSAVISLVDAAGMIRARTVQLQGADPPFRSAIRAVTAADGTIRPDGGRGPPPPSR